MRLSVAVVRDCRRPVRGSAGPTFRQGGTGVMKAKGRSALSHGKW